MSVRSSKLPETTSNVSENPDLIHQTSQPQIKENDQNKMSNRPLLERFEPGVLQIFFKFTVLMFLFYDTLITYLKGDIVALVFCLFSSMIIIASFVYFAFHEDDNNNK
ncbi:hypothetical protein ENUP19_0002G0069 [Entamoeba nuttalli]|uniref:Uncharacterized protein n=1 Tax=Entamoeba nuttalli TaxID=412467 RepID=A0ABQ0D776_9EUKA